jgi:RNA recognition motif-containing protein
MQNNKLFVRNLSFSTTDGELSGLFADFGNVVSARMATERETGRPRGFGFVEMSSPESAQDAIRGLDSREFNGRTMYVAMSEQRSPKASSAYGNY